MSELIRHDMEKQKQQESSKDKSCLDKSWMQNSYDTNDAPLHVQNEINSEAGQKKGIRNILLPLLISVICIGNIVLLFMAVYYGNDDILFDREGRAKIILAAPVFIYSIFPFYKRIFSSIGSKLSGMDLINSFIAGVGFALSIYNYHIGYEDVYIVSITIFIFLHFTGWFFLETCKGRNVINFISSPGRLIIRYLFHSHVKIN